MASSSSNSDSCDSRNDWQDLSKSDYAKVIFSNMCYDSECCEVCCQFKLTDAVTKNPLDYVGLYKVGYDNLSQCFASKKISELKFDEDAKVINCAFKYEDKSELDGYFQFLYVTHEGEVFGASMPFAVNNVKNKDVSFCDDLSTEKVEDGFLMVHNLEKINMMENLIEKEHQEKVLLLAKCEKLKLEKESLLEDIKMSEQHYNQVVHRLLCLTEENKKITSELEKIKEENSVYANDLVASKKAASDLSEKVLILETDSETLLKEISSLSLEKDKLKEEKESLQHSVKEKEKQYHQELQKLKCLKDENNHLREELKFTKKDKQLCADNLVVSEKALSDLKDEVQLFKNDNKMLLKKLNSVSVERDTLSTKLATQKKNCENLSEMIASLTETSYKDIEFQKTRKNSLSFELKEAKCENELLQERLALSQKEVGRVTTKLEELSVGLDIALFHKNKLSEQLKMAKEENSQLRVDCPPLSDDPGIGTNQAISAIKRASSQIFHVSKESNIEVRQPTLGEYVRKLRRKESENLAHQNYIEFLKGDLASATLELETLKDRLKVDQLNKEFEIEVKQPTLEENNKLQNEVRKLKLKESDSLEHIRLLKGELEAAKLELKKFNDRLKMKVGRENFASAHYEGKEMSSEVKFLSEQLDDARYMIQALEDSKQLVIMEMNDVTKKLEEVTEQLSELKCENILLKVNLETKNKSEGWIVPNLIDAPPPLIEPGSQSREKEVERLRQQFIAQEIANGIIPSSPREPDLEVVPPQEPKIIPVDECISADNQNEIAILNNEITQLKKDCLIKDDFIDKLNIEIKNMKESLALSEEEIKEKLARLKQAEEEYRNLYMEKLKISKKLNKVLKKVMTNSSTASLSTASVTDSISSNLEIETVKESTASVNSDSDTGEHFTVKPAMSVATEVLSKSTGSVASGCEGEQVKTSIESSGNEQDSFPLNIQAVNASTSTFSEANGEPDYFLVRQGKIGLPKTALCSDKDSASLPVPEVVRSAYELPCSICGKLYADVQLLDHCHVAHNMNACPICGKLFEMSIPKKYFLIHVNRHFQDQ